MQKVIILSGPSGVGKNTLGDKLLQIFPQLSYSISATTRKIRTGETQSVDYHFIETQDFEAKIAADEFLEWQEVYDNTYYGTLKSELDRINTLNQFPLLVIDVFGAINVMNNLKFKPLTIFIDIPDIKTLTERLSGRATETPEKIQLRIEKASLEIQQKHLFDIAIVNDDLEIAVKQLVAVVNHFLLYIN